MSVLGKNVMGDNVQPLQTRWGQQDRQILSPHSSHLVSTRPTVQCSHPGGSTDAPAPIVTNFPRLGSDPVSDSKCTAEHKEHKDTGNDPKHTKLREELANDTEANALARHLMMMTMMIHRTTFTGSPLRPCGEKILVATRRDGLDGAWSILNIDANSGEVIRETSSPVIIPSISSSAFAPNGLAMAVGCRNGDLLIVSNAFGNVQ